MNLLRTRKLCSCQLRARNRKRLSEHRCSSINHLSMTALGFERSAPTTGRLFAIAFNVTGSSTTSIGFQTGCSQISVPSNTCVTVAICPENPNVCLPEPETVQTASFAHMTGDVNYDCRVDLTDLVLVAEAFGSTPNSPAWNPDCGSQWRQPGQHLGLGHRRGALRTNMRLEPEHLANQCTSLS